MKRKESPKTENKFEHDKDETLRNKRNRERNIMNVIVNTSIILMCTLMDGLTQIMMDTMGAVASVMTGAVGGEEAGEKVNREFKQKQPEVDEKIRTMISDVRKDVHVQLGQKRKEIEPFLSDPAFDAGPKMTDEYDFKLPKLTEELDDSSLAQYIRLLVSQDPSFVEMFEKLTCWMNTLPKFTEKISKKRCIKAAQEQQSGQAAYA
jgi:uncharacterized membrane protein